MDAEFACGRVTASLARSPARRNSSICCKCVAVSPSLVSICTVSYPFTAFLSVWQLVLKEEERKDGWFGRSCADELFSKNEGLYEVFASRELPDRVKEAIEKDLDRTLPAMKGEKKDALRRILRALASFQHEIGYVQGLNYVAATLLYHVHCEAHVFWIMVQLFKRYSFTEYYRRGMPGLEAFFEVLRQGIQLHAPTLSKHFQREDILTNMFSMKWALTLFGCKAKVEHSAAIMDVFLHVGWDFIINLSLSLLIEAQEAICKLPSEDILVFMESVPCNFELERMLKLTSVLMHKTQKWKLKKASSAPNMIITSPPKEAAEQKKGEYPGASSSSQPATPSSPSISSSSYASSSSMPSSPYMSKTREISKSSSSTIASKSVAELAGSSQSLPP